MDDKFTNKSAPQPPRCHRCARPMQLFAELHDLVGCLISTPSTAAYVMSGTLKRAALLSSWNCMPELRQQRQTIPVIK